MKVLWIINAPTPTAARAMGVRPSGFPSWIEGAHQAMLARADVEVSIAFPSPGDPRSASAEGSTYATFPVIGFGRERDGVAALEAMIARLSPDLVHIFGTEGGHAYPAALACTRLGVPFVVGLQGLSSTISQHYLSGLPASVSRGFTIRDAIRRDNIARQAARYRARGLTEARTLGLARYVIGRTTWDRAVSEQLNPAARYFAVPETLRPAFYGRQWSLDACQAHSMFVSQGHYPIKGLHFVLRALPTIVGRYPDARLFVSGGRIRAPGLKGRLRQTRYDTYLTRLISQTGMAGHVQFVGVLGEAEMIARYLGSHVFVSASTVENESNSLSEASLLGVPAVASYVGGVVDRIDHGTTGFFYQHDAPYMLAHYVTALFGDPDLCGRFSAASRAASLQLNDAAHNGHALRDVYATMLRDGPRHVRG